MDRRPPRAFDRRQSLAPAIAQDPRRGRRPGRHPGHRRSLFPRSGRLCAHPRDPRGAYDGRHPARPLSGAGLSLGRALPVDQQDAGRDLSGAGALRNHLRARAAGRRHRGQARHRPHRYPPPQRHHVGRDALPAAARGAGRGNPLRHRRLYRAARQTLCQDRLGRAQRRCEKAPSGRRTGRHRGRHVRGKKRDSARPTA